MKPAAFLLAVLVGVAAKGAPMAMQLKSPAFTEGGVIPRENTCDGLPGTTRPSNGE